MIARWTGSLREGAVDPRTQVLAWANFVGVSGTVTDSEGISSVTRNAAGRYTLVYSLKVASGGHYVAFAGSKLGWTAFDLDTSLDATGTKIAGSGGGSFGDPTDVYFMIMGEI